MRKTPPPFNYEVSRNIDVNLAEIDMENFRSEDINAVLAGTSAGVWDSSDDMASVTDSMIRELVESNYSTTE